MYKLGQKKWQTRKGTTCYYKTGKTKNSEDECFLLLLDVCRFTKIF